MLKSLKQSRGQTGGLITGLVGGVAGLIILVIIALVIVGTINDAGLLTSGTQAANTTDGLETNFSTGINEISAKIPTIMLVAAIVLLISVLVLLVVLYKRVNFGSGSL